MTTELAYEFRRIPIGLIDEPEIIARLGMDDDKLDELTVDIGRRGVIQPISVVQHDERYEVIAGHRRRKAAGRAGLVVMPCLVYPTTDAAHEGLKYAENAFREDMSPADEAYYFSELLEKRCGGDIEQVASIVGRKVSYVDNRLQLFQGDQDIFGAVQRREISLGVAHELNKVTDPRYRNYFLVHAKQSGATVAIVVAWVTDWKRNFGDVPQAPAPSTDPAPIVVSSNFDIHKCAVCLKSDPRYIPESIQVHTHCRIAILDPLLDAARGGAQVGE